MIPQHDMMPQYNSTGVVGQPHLMNHTLPPSLGQQQQQQQQALLLQVFKYIYESN